MKTKSTLAAVVTLALAASLFTATSAFADTSGDFSYAVDNGTASVTGYSGASTDMVIPATLGGFPVTSIAVRAFQDHALTSVALPEGLLIIGALAFVRTSLTSITLPSTLTTLESGALSENSLTSVTIPASVTVIEDNAFYQSPGLQSVIFRGNAPTMSAAAFQGAVADFTVTHGSTATGFGSGTTWLGFTVLTFAVTPSDVTAGVTAGVRTAGLTIAAFDALSFAHSDRSSTADLTLSADDLTGANAGWNVTVSSSVLTWTASSGGPLTGSDLPASALAITTVGDITTVAGDDWTGSTNTGALDSPVNVLSTSGGNGSYTTPLTLTLTVPGQASVGTYAGTLTTTISAAP
jgi:hypothetical protein